MNIALYLALCFPGLMMRFLNGIFGYFTDLIFKISGLSSYIFEDVNVTRKVRPLSLAFTMVVLNKKVNNKAMVNMRFVVGICMRPIIQYSI